MKNWKHSTSGLTPHPGGIDRPYKHCWSFHALKASVLDCYEAKQTRVWLVKLHCVIPSTCHVACVEALSGVRKKGRKACVHCVEFWMTSLRNPADMTQSKLSKISQWMHHNKGGCKHCLQLLPNMGVQIVFPDNQCYTSSWYGWNLVINNAL